jgi:GNAT superfamily N-acetyltransferase
MPQKDRSRRRGALIIRSPFPARLAPSPPCSPDLAALGLRLRDAADADWPFLQALFASFRAEEMALLGWPQAHLDALLNDQCRLQHHHLVTHFAGADFWIVERPDRDGGSLPVGRFYLDRSTPLWRVVDLGFLPEARGQGRGSALLAWAQAAAVAAGAAGIDLHVAASNHRARSLYRRLGFRPAQDSEGYHPRLVWQAA